MTGLFKKIRESAVKRVQDRNAHITIRQYIAVGMVVLFCLLLMWLTYFLFFMDRLQGYTTHLSEVTLERILLTKQTAVNFDALHANLDIINSASNFSEVRNAYMDISSMLLDVINIEDDELNSSAATTFDVLQELWSEWVVLEDSYKRTVQVKKRLHNAVVQAATLLGIPALVHHHDFSTTQRLILGQVYGSLIHPWELQDERYRTLSRACREEKNPTPEMKEACLKAAYAYSAFQKETSSNYNQFLIGERLSARTNTTVNALIESYSHHKSREIYDLIVRGNQLEDGARTFVHVGIVIQGLVVFLLVVGCWHLLKPQIVVSEAIRIFKNNGEVRENPPEMLIQESNEVVTLVWQMLKNLKSKEIEKVELDTQNEQLHLLSTTDELTRLSNRRALKALMDSIVTPQRGMAVAMVDIDHFKKINDTMGHGFGDTILVAVSDVLLASVQSECQMFRYGGEEFCLVFFNQTPATLLIIAARLLRLVKRIDRLHGKTLNSDELVENPLSVSIGLSAVVSTPGEYSFPTLIAQADDALYQSKNKGRDCFTVYAPVVAKI